MFEDLFSVILMIAFYPALILFLLQLLSNFKELSKQKNEVESSYCVILVPLRGVYELIPEILTVARDHTTNYDMINKVDSFRQKSIKLSNSVSLNYDETLIKALETAHIEMEKTLVSVLNTISVGEVSEFKENKFKRIATLFLELNERRQRLNLAIIDYNQQVHNFNQNRKKILNLLCALILGIPSYCKLEMGLLQERDYVN